MSKLQMYKDLRPTSSMASWILALSGTREHTTAKIQKRKRNTEDRQPRTLSNWIMHKAKIWMEINREAQRPLFKNPHRRENTHDTQFPSE